MPIECPDWDNETWISTPEYISYAASQVVEWWGHPHSGKFVDLGCSRGGITLAIAKLLPDAVTVEGVDSAPVIPPKSVTGRVTFYELDAIEYLRAQATESIDGILLKQVMHCFSAERQTQLFEEMTRTMTSSGKILVLGLPEPSRVRVPLFRAALERYDEEYQNADSIVLLAKEFGFRAEASEFCFPVRVSREAYFNMIRRRFLSSLRDLTDRQIEEGIRELEASHPGSEIAFDDKLYAFHLTKSIVREK
ncbi:MAG: class I SAM-dependent methyltransferase [Bdellovibrionota bacterium]